MEKGSVNNYQGTVVKELGKTEFRTQESEYRSLYTKLILKESYWLIVNRYWGISNWGIGENSCQLTMNRDEFFLRTQSSRLIAIFATSICCPIVRTGIREFRMSCLSSQDFPHLSFRPERRNLMSVIWDCKFIPAQKISRLHFVRIRSFHFTQKYKKQGRRLLCCS